MTINELSSLNLEVNKSSSQVVEEDLPKIRSTEKPRSITKREEEFKRPVKKV